MTRFLLSAAATAMLLAAPVAASAATTTSTPPTATKPAMAAKPAKPAVRRAMRHSAVKPVAARSRDGGSSAVDALNEQSLARAKAGQ